MRPATSLSIPVLIIDSVNTAMVCTYGSVVPLAFFTQSPDILMFFFAFLDRRSFFLKKSEATSLISCIGGKSLKFTAMSL